MSEALGDLGAARECWDRVLAMLAAEFGLRTYEWKGGSLRVKRKDRTILYLLPGAGEFRAAFVLGDRAVAASQSAALPERIHRLIAEARRYAEGTGFRINVASDEDITAIQTLTAIKLAP